MIFNQVGLPFKPSWFFQESGMFDKFVKLFKKKFTVINFIP